MNLKDRAYNCNRRLRLRLASPATCFNFGIQRSTFRPTSTDPFVDKAITSTKGANTLVHEPVMLSGLQRIKQIPQGRKEKLK